MFAVASSILCYRKIEKHKKNLKNPVSDRTSWTLPDSRRNVTCGLWIFPLISNKTLQRAGIGKKKLPSRSMFVGNSFHIKKDVGVLCSRNYLPQFAVQPVEWWSFSEICSSEEGADAKKAPHDTIQYAPKFHGLCVKCIVGVPIVWVAEEDALVSYIM